MFCRTWNVSAIRRRITICKTNIYPRCECAYMIFILYWKFIEKWFITSCDIVYTTALQVSLRDRFQNSASRITNVMYSFLSLVSINTTQNQYSILQYMPLETFPIDAWVRKLNAKLQLNHMFVCWHGLCFDICFNTTEWSIWNFLF